MDELSDVLTLATDDELYQIADILFRRKFNPLDYFATPPDVPQDFLLDRENPSPEKKDLF